MKNDFQALKPKVKIEGGKELVYREGETATIFADVPSEPAAEDIRWFVGGFELVHDPKNGIVIDNTKEHKSKLQIDAVSRKHEGMYCMLIDYLNQYIFEMLNFVLLAIWATKRFKNSIISFENVFQFTSLLLLFNPFYNSFQFHKISSTNILFIHS